MPFNFSWLLDGKVAGMAHPPPDAESWLSDQGVTSVVSLTMRAPDSLGDLNTLHAPIPDMTPPSLDLLMKTVEFMREELVAGGAVAVHCTAGIGRTGTVLAAFLVSNGLTAGEAIRAVRSRRPGSIETRSQEEIVHKFADLMGVRKS